MNEKGEIYETGFYDGQAAEQSSNSESDLSALLCVGDLVVLIRRLAHSLNKASPDNVLVKQAMGYLSRTDKKGCVTREASMFSDFEIKRMAVNPDVLRAVANEHDCSVCEGESMGYDCSGNIKRAKELVKLADEIDANI